MSICCKSKVGYQRSKSPIICSLDILLKLRCQGTVHKPQQAKAATSDTPASASLDQTSHDTLKASTIHSTCLLTCASLQQCKEDKTFFALKTCNHCRMQAALLNDGWFASFKAPLLL